MALCCWETGVSSPLLPAVSQPRRHGGVAKMSGAKKFSFRQIRFIFGWRSKPKLNDGLDVWPKGYR